MGISEDDLKKLRANIARARGAAPLQKIRKNGFPASGRGKPTFTRSKPEDRSWGGVVYASRGEMDFAKKLELERFGDPRMWWVRQPVFDLAGVKYQPDFLVVRPPVISFERDAKVVTVYEIKPRIKNPRFRQEALRRFTRNAAQVKTLWGVEVVLVEV